MTAGGKASDYIYRHSIVRVWQVAVLLVGEAAVAQDFIGVDLGFVL